MQYGSLGLPYPVSLILVLEMTHSCAKHGDAAFVRFLHRIFIADTSSRLNDGLYAIFRSEGYRVVKWEETVRAEYESFVADVLACFCKSCRCLLKRNLG